MASFYGKKDHNYIQAFLDGWSLSQSNLFGFGGERHLERAQKLYALRTPMNNIPTMIATNVSFFPFNVFLPRKPPA
eukprot:3064119-Pleurochrysis_carterae.AAC.1